MSENTELISLLRSLRHTSYRFSFDWDGLEYELTVFNDDMVTVFNARGQLREIALDALVQIERAKP